MKDPITPLRLSKLSRQQLEHISDRTGQSMARVVEHLLNDAMTRPERWPRQTRCAAPLRGSEWRKVRARRR